MSACLQKLLCQEDLLHEASASSVPCDLQERVSASRGSSPEAGQDLRENDAGATQDEAVVTGCKPALEKTELRAYVRTASQRVSNSSAYIWFRRGKRSLAGVAQPSLCTGQIANQTANRLACTRLDDCSVRVHGLVCTTREKIRCDLPEADPDAVLATCAAGSAEPAARLHTQCS